MIYANEKTCSSLAMDLTLMCVEKMIEQEDDTSNLVPAGGKKCFRDTLTINKNKVSIWYNDKDNSTKLATIEIEFKE